MAHEDKSPINPYALGASFLEYYVRQRRLRKEGQGRASRWYLTEAREEGAAEIRR